MPAGYHRPVPEVRERRSTDVQGVASSLARAFARSRGVVPLPRRASLASRLQAFFRLQLRANYLRRGEVFTTADHRRGGDVDAAHSAAAAPCRRPGPRRSVACWRGRVPARVACARSCSSRTTPRAAHCYLGSIGTEPARQRRGVGLGLARSRCSPAVTPAIPAYLECSRLENVAFYERHGFAVTCEVLAPDGGPPLWLMWRRPLQRP